MYPVLYISFIAGMIVGLIRFTYELMSHEYIQNHTWRLASICLRQNLNETVFFYLCAGVVVSLLFKVCSRFFGKKTQPVQWILAWLPIISYCWWLLAYYTLYTFKIQQITASCFSDRLPVDERLFLISGLKPVFIIITCSLCIIPVCIWLFSKFGFFKIFKPNVKHVICVICFFVAINISDWFFAKSLSHDRPNVVVIVIDTLRADHLAIYGYKHDTAPFITELSDKSVIYENSFSTSSWTSPSTASLFTSLYPFQHGVTKGIFATLKFLKERPHITLNTIPSKLTTLPELFRNSGYTTFGISDNLHICKAEGFDQGFDTFQPTYRYQGAQAINKTLFSWAPKIKKSSPYFLYIHYMDPHKPYNQHSPWFKDQNNTFRNLIAAYDSEIRYVDEHIKQLFSLYNWQENTIVIITSDHGESFRDHSKRIGHGSSLFNEEIRVPLLLYAPHHIAAQRITENVSAIDIIPTLAEMTGIRDTSLREGRSIMPITDAVLRERYIYGHLFNRQEIPDADEEQFSLYAIIHKNWKYITSRYYTTLFNVSNDPAEKVNLVTTKTTMAQKLAEQLVRFKTTCKRYGRSKTTFQLSDTQINELKSLGYVQ